MKATLKKAIVSDVLDRLAGERSGIEIDENILAYKMKR